MRVEKIHSECRSFVWFGLMRELYKRRELLMAITARELKVRYKQSLLGASWAILQPLSLMVIFTIVFSKFARVPSEGMPYPIFSFTALLPWTLFSSSLSSAIPSIVNNSSLITKVRLQDEGDFASVETEVPIKVDAGGITIAGKIDVRSEWSPFGRGMVKDVKTGNPRVSDQVQVLLEQHMEVVSGRTDSEKGGGERVYKDGTVQQVPYWWWQEPAVQRRLAEALDAIRRESLDVEPRRDNCLFCPLKLACHAAWTEEAA